MSQDPVVPVQKSHACCQIRNQQDSVSLVEMTGKLDALDKADMLSLQGEVLKSVVGTVCYQQEWGFAASIEGDSVRTVELSWSFPLPTKAPEELTFTVVLVNIAGAIAVPDIDIPIGAIARLVGWYLVSGLPSPSCL